MTVERLRVWKAGQLSWEDYGGHAGRNASVWRLIQQADAEYDLPDFPPVLISTADRPVDRTLSFSTSETSSAIPIPDFLFDAWPEAGIFDYEQACDEVMAAGLSPARQMVVGWIGNADTHPARRALLALAAISPLIDARHTPWPPDGTQRLTLAEQISEWGLLLDVEGNGWSARLKLLLHSGRPVLVADRPWREWWFPEFRVWEHYVPVRRDLLDLCDRVEWVLQHPQEAQRIGCAGQAFARRVLTRRRAVSEWAGILRGRGT